MKTAKSHYFSTRDGLKLHYLSWGKKNAPTILLLHGLRSYALTWENLAEVLSEQYYVIALDQRGRGLSEWATNYQSYQTHVYVQDIEDLVQVEKLEKFIIIGHSLGGANALEYNRLHPGNIQALIIEDIGPGSSTAGEGAQRIRHEMLTTPFTFSSWQQAEKFWKTLRPLSSDAGIQSRLQNTLVEKNGQIVWRHDQHGIAKARLTLTPTELWPAIEHIDCPTLFIKGGCSDFLPLNTINSIKIKKPAIECIEIPDASHYVHDDQSQLYNQVVCQFLNTLN